MASFPNLRTGQPTMHGFTRVRSAGTVLKQFEDGGEQRWKGRAALARFALQFTDIDGFDLSKLRAFFISSKGQFDSTWDLTVDGATYQHCAFASDVFSFPESKPGRASGRLEVIQFIS